MDSLHTLLHFQFCKSFTLQTSCKCPCSYPVQFSNNAVSNSQCCQSTIAHPDWKISSMIESEGLTKDRASWTPFAHRRETAKPSYIKQRHSQAKPKHDPAHCTLQAKCTYPLSPVPPFCLCRTYLQRTLLEVTLQDEILTISILISSS